MAHTHEIIDSDKSFVIDPITRTISNNSDKVKLVQFDHNSERFTFQCPRMIEGHDMSQSTSVRVQYINIDKKTKKTNTGVYEVDDLEVSSDDSNTVVFSWLISRNATELTGTLSFLIEFMCIEDDTTVSYAWHTDIYKYITVSTGMDNGEVIEEKYPDILEKWKDEILAEIPNAYPHPITKIESLDKTNMVILRNLDSGTYVLYGYFKPHEGSSSTMMFGSNILVSIVKKTSESHVQIFYPNNNCVQYVKITDTSYERKNIYLSDLADSVAEIGDLNDLSTEAKDKLVTAINEVSAYNHNIVNGKAINSIRTTGAAAEDDSYSLGPYAFAEGNGTKAIAAMGHAEGLNTTVGANATAGHAEGYNTSVNDGNYGHAEGSETSAKGYAAHAEGHLSKTESHAAHAEGYQCTASSDSSHAEGEGSTASSHTAHAEGYKTTASGEGAHAEGYQTTAKAAFSHAGGQETTASDKVSHVEGIGTVSRGEASFVCGKYNYKRSRYEADDYAFIVGNGTSDTNRSESFRLGWDGKAQFAGDVYVNGVSTSSQKKLATEEYVDSQKFSGSYDDLTDKPTIPTNILNGKAVGSLRTIDAEAEGNNYTLGPDAFAEGLSTKASSAEAHAEGDSTEASGHAAHAEGYKCIASAHASHAEGDETTAGQSYSHAEGYKTSTSSAAAHAEGSETSAEGYGAHAEGGTTTAAGRYSHTEGEGTTTKWDASHAEGYQTHAYSGVGHAEGYQTVVGDDATKSSGLLAAHAEGYKTKAIGTGSHAEGYNTTASYRTDLGAPNAPKGFSHAEGYGTTASGNASHAEGESTTASADGAHAEGYKTTASKYYAHAEGYGTLANGYHGSHAEGYYTTTTGEATHAQGKYNVDDSTMAHIVGNGSSDSKRSNAHTLDWSGNAWFAGDVYTGSTSGTNKDDGSTKLATEDYVNNAVSIEAPFAFTINRTENASDGTYTYSADKTFAEILEAAQTRIVIAKDYADNYYDLTFAPESTDTALLFQMRVTDIVADQYAKKVHYTINSDNTIIRDELSINSLPAITTADVGKVLSISDSATPVWKTLDNRVAVDGTTIKFNDQGQLTLALSNANGVSF